MRERASERSSGAGDQRRGERGARAELARGREALPARNPCLPTRLRHHAQATPAPGPSQAATQWAAGLRQQRAHRLSAAACAHAATGMPAQMRAGWLAEGEPTVPEEETEKALAPGGNG